MFRKDTNYLIIFSNYPSSSETRIKDMTDRDNRNDIVRIAVALGDNYLFEKYRTGNDVDDKFNTAMGYAMAGRLAEAKNLAHDINMSNSWLITD